MQATRRHKDDDAEEESPFVGVEKAAVLRESRIFNDQQIDPIRCVSVLTKLLYLLAQGESFSGEELERVFFSMTKLFQCHDVHLRRMVYLLIKELKVASDAAIIVISCLTKDMNSDIATFRGNSIRVLSKIMDPSMVGNIERFLKQALVHRNPFIVSSTLIAGHSLVHTNLDVIKRWTNDVQEALTNNCKMVQYHSLSLLYQLKQNDKLALSKVVTSLARQPPRGPLAQCLVIRIIFNLLNTSSVPTANNPLLHYVSEQLHNRSYLVMYEAARAMCRLECLSPKQIEPAISVLQEFLTSPMPAQRFSAVRTLSEVVARHPKLVAPCSVDLETCITDSNRSIATLAITTLLKTGMESNVDRLMKTIIGFMSEISDEFKIVLVDAIKVLCLKFHHKHHTLMAFLASGLREEGGFKYKEAIIDAMLSIVQQVPESLEIGLEHFCEFIEDCEFTALSVKVLHFLGDQASKAPNPKFIRFIFNRVVLETAAVRSAAVNALGKIGCSAPSLRENICVLLQRCLNDNDDEVRDQVVFYLQMLRTPPSLKKCADLVFTGVPARWSDLELSLQTYLENNDAKVPFDLMRHMIVAEQDEDDKDSTGDVKKESKKKKKRSGMYDEILNAVPEIAQLGKLFRSCEPVELTEAELEYVVSCVKHIYTDHVVFHYTVENKMEETQIEEVTVELDLDEDHDDWEVEFVVPAAEIKFEESGTVFVCLRRPEGSFASGSIMQTLFFTTKDVYSGGEVEAVGQQDECELDEIEISECAFMQVGPNFGLPEFKQCWEKLGNNGEVVKRYALGLNSLQEAVDAVCTLIGMRACENTNKVPESAPSHGIQLSGLYYGGITVLCRAGFLLNPTGEGVTLKIAVRSADRNISSLIAMAVR